MKEAPNFRVTVVGDANLVEPTRALFARHGLGVDVELVHPAADPSSVLFENIASLVIVGPTTAFLSAFAAAAGKDAWDSLKAFLRDRRAQHTELVLVGSQQEGIRVLLGEALPDEALRALFEMDLTPFADADPLSWDADVQEWRPTTYPKRRRDLLGWFASVPQEGRTTWHLVRDSHRSPRLTACGRQLESPHRFEPSPWRTGNDGEPCSACIGASSHPT